MESVSVMGLAGRGFLCDVKARERRQAAVHTEVIRLMTVNDPMECAAIPGSLKHRRRSTSTAEK